LTEIKHDTHTKLFVYSSEDLTVFSGNKLFEHSAYLEGNVTQMRYFVQRCFNNLVCVPHHHSESKIKAPSRHRIQFIKAALTAQGILQYRT
jgi:hypothetical protein